MTGETVLALAERSVWITLLISAPLLFFALAVGFLVSIFQATTQIQEQTLAFIPKIVAVLIALVLFGPWMLQEMVQFTFDILSGLHEVGK